MSNDEEWADFLDPAADDPDLSADERAHLELARRALADPMTWDDPPVGLENRLLALASVTPQDAPGAADDVPSRGATGATAASRPARRLGSMARPGRLRLLAVAATAAAAVAVFGVVAPQVNQDPPVERYTMAGTPLAPKASATVDVESKVAGDAITLHITGLGPAPAGSYYGGWLTGPAGTVPVGNFHWRKGGIPIELWSGVDTVAYPDFVITLQREGEPYERSDQVVLRGSLRP